MTALDVAIQNNRPEIAKPLLKHGAKVDDHPICSPLLLAIHYSNHKITKDLLDRGANVNKKDKCSGVTPLVLASVDKQNIQIIQLLLEKGADKSMTDNDGQTAYETSIIYQNHEISELLQPRVETESSKKEYMYKKTLEEPKLTKESEIKATFVGTKVEQLHGLIK